jgi:hypothetical protein
VAAVATHAGWPRGPGVRGKRGGAGGGDTLRTPPARRAATRRGGGANPRARARAHHFQALRFVTSESRALPLPHATGSRRSPPPPARGHSEWLCWRARCLRGAAIGAIGRPGGAPSRAPGLRDLRRSGPRAVRAAPAPGSARALRPARSGGAGRGAPAQRAAPAADAPAAAARAAPRAARPRRRRLPTRQRAPAPAARAPWRCGGSSRCWTASSSSGSSRPPRARAACCCPRPQSRRRAGEGPAKAGVGPAGQASGPSAPRGASGRGASAAMAARPACQTRAGPSGQ